MILPQFYKSDIKILQGYFSVRSFACVLIHKLFNLTILSLLYLYGSSLSIDEKDVPILGKHVPILILGY